MQNRNLLSTLCLILLGLSVVESHSIFHRSHPSPKGWMEDDSHLNNARLEKLRKQPDAVFKDRFMEQYGKIMDRSNGYFSPDGVPYHSIETLMVEAPDYGHETTSETFSYYVWLTAEYGWANNQWSPFQTAWSQLEKYIIPTEADQPTVNSYNSEKPAEFAPEEDSPSDYPVPLGPNVPVGVDPLNAELAQVYGDGTQFTQFYASHWILDVDNIYGFGHHEDGTSKNVYYNSYQRGSNESVWRTIPQPEWEDFKYGNSQCGYLTLFINDPNGCNAQWRYTGAPDADARTIQATYWAIQWAKANGGDVSQEASKAQKLGDFVRYSLWDKYFKAIPCYDLNCPGTTWSNSWNSTLYLITWYYSWGGNIGSYAWSFRISASHAHQGYQNVMTAYALFNEPLLTSKTTGGPGQWKGVMYRTMEFWHWLQSSEGAIAGGTTSSWRGHYANPAEDGITGYFYGLPYDWQPVYHDPPSNNWFGMQAWSMERLAEYYYVTGNVEAKAIMDKWWSWIEGLIPDILLGNGDFQVPSTLNWAGQPDNWTGTYTGNPNLHVTIVDYSQDVGVASALAQALAWYSAKNNNSEAQMLSREILDRMYAHYNNVSGIVTPEARQDYIGNKWGRGFDEPVYVPNSYTGKYPNGDQIKSGDTFLDIRTWYKNDPMYINTYLPAKKANKAPVFWYHRFWAQASIACAFADYARLFSA